MPTHPIDIRTAHASDAAALPAIEASGDVMFRPLGMALVADAEPADATTYAAAAAAGEVLVAVDAAGEPVGFLRLTIVDGGRHVEQLSVRPDHGRHGVGTALLAAAEELARREGRRRLTLRTFTEVPFNGPFYARRGWVPLREDEAGPELRALRDNEERAGLLAWPRQAMAKDL